jgi:hypothetical protein
MSCAHQKRRLRWNRTASIGGNGCEFTMGFYASQELIDRWRFLCSLKFMFGGAAGDALDLQKPRLEEAT